MKPEQTQGGGFAGGTFIGAPNVNTRSPLSALSEALGVVGNNVTEIGVDNFVKNIDTKKQAALDAAAVFEQTTAGYTSEKLNAEIESEPMLAKFKENPYLLPAINVYRGRKLADELGLKMVQSGIDVGDPDGVRQFYEENAPDLKDPFYARGFNEQNARLQAQFSQRQLQDAINQVETETVEASSALFKDEFLRTGDIASTTAALRASPFGAKLSPAQLNDIQLELATALALDGNLDAFDKLTTTKRGDAPSLMDSTQTMVDVRRLRAQAENVAHEKTSGQRRAAMDTLETEINAGRLTSNALLRDPRYLSLAEPGQAPDAMSAAQKAVKDQYDAAQIRFAEKAERERAAREMQNQIDEVVKAAAAKMDAGQGWTIGDVKIPNFLTGATKTVTGAQQIEIAREGRRKAVLGDNPAAYTGDDAPARYQSYFSYLDQNNTWDPQLKKAMGSMVANLTPEGLREDPQSGTQALLMYRNMSDNQRRLLALNPREDKVLKMSATYLSENPLMKPEVALSKAVQRADSGVPRVERSGRLITEAAKGLLLPDPSGAKMGFSGRRKPFSPDQGQVSSFLQERITEGLQFGMTEDEAIAYARSDAAAMFTVVNGTAVMLPQRPDKNGLIAAPEDWAKSVATTLGGIASAEGLKMDDVYMTAKGVGENRYDVFQRQYDEEGNETAPLLLDTVTASEVSVAAAMTSAAAGSLVDRITAKPPAAAAASSEPAKASTLRKDREIARRASDPTKRDFLGNELEFANE